MVEFDPKKDVANRAKHGFPLLASAEMWEGLVLDEIDKRQDYGEVRRQLLGKIGARIMVCIYTMRGDEPRYISLRKANKREQKRYEQFVEATKIRASQKD